LETRILIDSFFWVEGKRRRIREKKDSKTGGIKR
jgi:hypothetical protein